jgi:PAS domain S-box-containing protein
MAHLLSPMPLSEAFGDVVWVRDYDTSALLYISPGAREFYGLDPDQTSFDAIISAVHPEDRRRVAGLRESIVDGITAFDYRFYRRGELRHANVRARYVFGENGRPKFVEGVVSDITARVHAERLATAQARRAQTLVTVAEKLASEPELSALAPLLCEQLLRALPVDGVALRLLDPANECFVTIGLAGTSPGLMTPTPRARYDSIIARLGPRALVRDVQIGPEFENDRELFRTLDLRTLIYTSLHRDGRLVGILVGASFGKTVELDGDALELVRAIGDLGGLAVANAELLAESRRAAEHYRNIVETATEGIAILTPDWSIRFANRQLASMLGMEIAELIGTSVASLLHPDDSKAARAQFARRLAGAVGAYRYRLCGKDGRVVHVQSNACALRENGQPVGMLVLLSDVSESHKLEEKLQQAQKLESLGVLAGGIAHDFNNLLVSILGNAGIALMELPPESQARPVVEDIQTASLRAADLTKQLLAYSGKGRFVLTKLDLGRLVEEMAHLLSAVIGKGVLLKYRFVPNLPLIEGDATQVRQIVMNLITNASDAIGARSGIITVATSVVRADRAYLADTYIDDNLAPGDYVSLEVSDTGAGMTAETRARIFDPFFTTKFAGRGLGLAATLGILRAHKGATKVYSEPGRGTTIRVLLPAIDGGVESRDESRARARPAAGTAGVVLVVDDEEGVRNVTRRILERAGFTVLTANDGRDGVDLFRTRPSEIRLVVLDVTMPRMGGEEAFHELRRIRADVPVILASGFSEQEATSRFAGKGLAGFLEKPFGPQTLLEKVRETLGP